MDRSQFVLHLFIPGICFLIEVFTHRVIARGWLRQGTVPSTLASWSIGLVFLLSLEFLLFNHPQNLIEVPAFEFSFFVIHFQFYSTLAFVYFCFFNIGETSLRIRILKELSLSPGGISPTDLERLYNSQAVVTQRIDRLIKSHQFRENSGLLYPGTKKRMIYLAQVVGFLKWLILAQDLAATGSPHQTLELPIGGKSEKV